MKPRHLPGEPTPEPMIRKPYTRPRLTVYGDLGVLTQNNNNMGAMDGSKAKAHGTRP